MENKKNTKFIVIAIVAALVFAGGITYAYFAASVSNTASKTVTAKTSDRDVFTTSGEVELSMDITNDVMQQSEGKNDYSVYESDEGTFTVSLTAGSGTATCSYDIALSDEGDQYAKSEDAGSLLEYTIKGSDGTQSFAEKNIDTALATNNGVLGSFTITDSYDEGTQVTTTQTWTVESRFYNLAKNQSAQLNQEFEHHVKVINVNCTNTNGSTPPASGSFATDDWNTVIANLKSGNNSYEVGDTRCVYLSGYDPTDGTNGCEDGGYRVRLVNKSTPAECSTPGFSQSSCGNVLEFIDLPAVDEDMRRKDPVAGYGTTEGGWAESNVRKYLNPIDEVSGSGEFFNALPEVVKNAIIPTTVVSGHGCHEDSNIVSTDKIYILSLSEMFSEVGDAGILSDFDTAYGTTRQLDYYANNNVMINPAAEDEFEMLLNSDKAVNIVWNIPTYDDYDNFLGYKNMAFVEKWLRTPVPISDMNDCNNYYNDEEYFGVMIMDLEGYGSGGALAPLIADRPNAFSAAFRI